jgi:hypothetical protein
LEVNYKGSNFRKNKYIMRELLIFIQEEDKIQLTEEEVISLLNLSKEL